MMSTIRVIILLVAMLLNSAVATGNSLDEAGASPCIEQTSDVAQICELESRKVWFICSDPLDSPAQSGRPPFAILTVMSEVGSGQSIISRGALTPDNICLEVRSFKVEKSQCIFTIASRPLPGSIAVNHMRVYRFDCSDSQPLSLQFMVSYIDGAVLPLQKTNATVPAFLVIEPTYEVIPKALPQPYRFRLYAWNGSNYFLKFITRTSDRYETSQSAYASFRTQLREMTGDDYLLPAFVDGTASQE